MSTAYCEVCKCLAERCICMMPMGDFHRLCDRVLGDSERGLYGDEGVVEGYRTRTKMAQRYLDALVTRESSDSGPRDPAILDASED